MLLGLSADENLRRWEVADDLFPSVIVKAACATFGETSSSMAEGGQIDFAHVCGC